MRLNVQLQKRKCCMNKQKQYKETLWKNMDYLKQYYKLVNPFSKCCKPEFIECYY